MPIIAAHVAIYMRSCVFFVNHLSSLKKKRIQYLGASMHSAVLFCCSSGREKRKEAFKLSIMQCFSETQNLSLREIPREIDLVCIYAAHTRKTMEHRARACVGINMHLMHRSPRAQLRILVYVYMYNRYARVRRVNTRAV